MSTDWRLSQLQREAQAKRGQLDALNAQIERLGAMLAEARSFSGHFNERLAEANRRCAEVGQRVDVGTGGFFGMPYHIHPDHPAELERRLDVVRGIEGERSAERERRTTTVQHGPHTLSLCELDPGDVITKRAHVVIRRDQVARELAAIEAQMSPGELVQSGVEAPDLAEHRQRVAKLREQMGIGASS